MPASTVKITGDDIILPVGGLVDGVDVGTAVPAAQSAADDAQADATQALTDAATALAAANEADDTADAAQTTANAHASRHLPGGADEVNPVAAHANLTDADQTIQWASTAGYARMPAGTTTAARAKTLGVATAVAGSAWVIDVYAQGHDVSFVNGGSGAGTVTTVTAGLKRRLVFRYDGTNWTAPARFPLA